MTEVPDAPTQLFQKVQEIPYDHPDSRYRFTARLVATRAALEAFGLETIIGCYLLLQRQAERCKGIDYLQVFQNAGEGPDLWLIDDQEIVTALLPSDY